MQAQYLALPRESSRERCERCTVSAWLLLEGRCLTQSFGCSVRACRTCRTSSQRFKTWSQLTSRWAAVACLLADQAAGSQQAPAQAGTVTKKNSCSRNLFRLCHGVLFISELLKYLYKDHNMQLKAACGEAYTNTLASAHSYMVKTAVRASMYMLPTREQFLKSIHETGAHCL